MGKANKSSKLKARRSASKNHAGNRAIWLIVGGSVLLLGVLVVLSQAIQPGASRDVTQHKVTPQVKGAPHLVANQDAQDFGSVKFDNPVEAIFELTNVGDQDLTFSEPPRVELVEGC